MSYQWNFSPGFSVRPCKIDSHVCLIPATKSKTKRWKPCEKKGMYTFIWEKLAKSSIAEIRIIKEKNACKNREQPAGSHTSFDKKKAYTKKPSQSAHKEIRENYLTYVTSVHLS